MVSFFERVKYLFTGNSEELQQETNKQVQEALRLQEEARRRREEEAARERKRRADEITSTIGGGPGSRPTVAEVKRILSANPWFDLDNIESWENDRFPGGKQSSTALTTAAQFQNHEVAKFLLERGADPTIRDSFNRDAAAWAIENLDAEMLETILSDPRANLDATNSRAPIQLEYLNLYTTPLTHVVMKASRDPKWREEDAQKILAVIDVIKKDGRFNLNGTDSMGRTALHWAIERGHGDVAEALMEVQGCNLNIKDQYGLTPLNLALDEYEEDMAVKLIEAGASLEPDKWGITPLRRSVSCPKALEALIKAGADVNQESKDFGGEITCPLETAVSYNKVDSVRILLENGADTSFLYEPRANNRPSIIEELRSDFLKYGQESKGQILALLDAHAQEQSNVHSGLAAALGQGAENITHREENRDVDVAQQYVSSGGR